MIDGLQEQRPITYIDSKDMYDSSVVGIDFFKNGAPYSQLNKIAGMPPSFNALIDPPLDKTKFSNVVTSFSRSEIAGADYTKNMVTRGQFLTLTPCKVEFGIAGDANSSTTENLISAQMISLKNDQARYWKLVNLYVRLSIMFLGISGLMDEATKSGIEIMNVPGFGAQLKDLVSINLGAKGVDSDGENHGWTGLGASLNDEGQNNSILRAVTNMRKVADHFIPFYVDGIAEETLDGSNDIGESEIGGAWKSKLRDMVDSQNGAGALKEIVMNSSFMSETGGSLKTLLYNPLVPQIWKEFNLSQSYNVKLKFVSVGADPFSILFFVIRPLAMILPFVRPIAATNATLNAYVSPFYCRAFSKGVMNVNEGIIAQASITRDSLFITTEGVPTALDVNITIVPLVAQQVQPSPGNLFIQNETQWRKEGSAALYLATVCGVNVYNTDFLEKVNQWLFGAKQSVSNTFNDIIPTIKNVGTDLVDNFSITKFF
ncbi:MAG: hypothetical protein ACRCX2_15680 [Paraclostridium sp.]